MSQVWAANPQLSYQQVKNILLQTATDLSAPGWDDQTGFGLLSLAAAVELAKATTPEAVPPVDKPVAQELPKASESPNLASIPASDEPGVLPGERPADSYSYSYSNSGDGYSSSYSYTGNYTGDWNAGTSDYSSRAESSSNYSSGSDGYSYNSRSRSLSTSESHSDWNPSRSRYNSSSDYSNTSSSSSQYNSSSNGYSYTSSSSSSSSSSGDSQWEGEYSRVSYEGRSQGEGSYQSSYDSNSSSESSYPDGSGYVSTSSSSSNSVTQWTSSWDNNSGSRYTSATTQTSWYYWYSLYYWAGGYRWSWQLTSTSSQSGYRDGQYWSNGVVTQTLSDSGEVEFNNDFFNEDDYFDSGSGGDDSSSGDSNGDKVNSKGQRLSQQQRDALARVIQQLREFFQPLAEFVAGAIYQWLHDNGETARWLLQALIPGWNGLEQSVERDLPKSWAFQAGRTFGDGAALVQGILEIVAGAGLDVGGGTLCITGVGCIVGAPAIAAATVLQIHGAATASAALRNIAQRLGVLYAEVIQQEVTNPDIEVGSGHPWTGSGSEPQWDNPKSTKAYGHIESTHGPKVKPSQFQGRIASTGNEQGQWYKAENWVEAEKLIPKHPGKYIIDMKRPIGRVYKTDGTTVENVTRAFVRRNPDGTLDTAFPVSDSYTY